MREEGGGREGGRRRDERERRTPKGELNAER